MFYFPNWSGWRPQPAPKKHKNVFIRLFLHTLITYWWELLSWFFGVLNLVTKTYWKENYRSGKSVDGGWSAWSLWSTCICDHISGTGTKMRTRSCTNPAPFCHGLWVDHVFSLCWRFFNSKSLLERWRETIWGKLVGLWSSAIANLMQWNTVLLNCPGIET